MVQTQKNLARRHNRMTVTSRSSVETTLFFSIEGSTFHAGQHPARAESFSLWKGLFCPFELHCNGKIYISNSNLLFNASALWADAFYKLICPYVCLCVCLSVCSLLKYRLNVFLPLLPKVQNPWGKVMERSGLRFETFTNKGCKIAAQRKVCFGATFAFLSRIFFGIGVSHSD